MPQDTDDSSAGGRPLTYETVPRCGAMLHRLTNWWWSPHPPEHYTYTVDGVVRGIGTVAYKLPAEFNLAWARDSKLLMNPKMEAYVMAGVNLSSLYMDTPVGGMPMRDWLTMCKPEYLSLELIRQNEYLSKVDKATISAAIRSAVRLRAT